MSEERLQAEREAEPLVARVGERCRSLIEDLERVQSLRAELDALLDAIAESLRRLEQDVGAGSREGGGSGERPRRMRFFRPGADAAPGPDRGRASAIAIQMKLAGAPRAGIEKHLRERLGIEDADALLDDVFRSRTHSP